MKKAVKEFKRSVSIMDRLRDKGGCPWDREQTRKTLKKYVIEEAFEVVEAIEKGKTGEIAEELGDLYFQVLFQSRIAKENKEFELADVLRLLNEKMERRHPHVFGKSKKKFANSKEVLLNWTRTKKREGKKSVLDGVPRKMPALLRAFRITEKAASVGFDWKEPQQVLDKLDEEIGELKREMKNKAKRKDRIEDELGDIMFTVVNFSRLAGIDPEASLRGTINKFKKRFSFIEKNLKKAGKDIRFVSLDEMEALWIKAKKTT